MTADEIYLALGQSIVDVIEEPWKEAVMIIKRVYKAAKFEGEYITEDGRKEGINMWEYNFDSTMIHRLHEIITSDGISRWNKLVFKILPTGKFELDFIWDQAYQDEMDRLSKEG